jgi:hypothetical protein
MYNLIFVVGALVVLAIVMIVFWWADLESPLRAASREGCQKAHEMYNRPCLHTTVASTLVHYEGKDMNSRRCMNCGKETNPNLMKKERK